MDKKTEKQTPWSRVHTFLHECIYYLGNVPLSTIIFNIQTEGNTLNNLIV
jgi:hypothetical protein